MTKNFQSIKSLPRDIIINLVVSLLVSTLLSSIPWILAGKTRFSIVLFGVLIISIPYLLFTKHKRLFKLIKAGMDGYYYSFDLSENRKVFHETQNTFCYHGILEKGKRGQDSPAVVIFKNPDYPSPFDPFKNTWDRMWADAGDDI